MLIYAGLFKLNVNKLLILKMLSIPIVICMRKVKDIKTNWEIN